MINTINEEKEFHELVHIIRGQQVMLDRDLAELYGYSVKRLNEQVNRNLKRSPQTLCFK